MQVPGPDTRVVELRVHGLLGPRPRDLTDSVASVDVAGDGVGRIVRPADRLLRPVPGPTLPAGERTVPRTVEGYVWGAMTSGGRKAAWALLFPFALVNAAQWMLPPSRSDSRVSGVLATALRALFRLAALLLTMLFVAQLTVVTLDLLAAQCLRPGSGCLSAVPDGVRGVALVRATVGIGLVGAVIAAMYRISGVSWRVRGPQTQQARHSARAPVLTGGNVVTEPETPSLRCLHIAAALSTVALLVAGGPFSPSADPRWSGAVAVLGLCVLGTLLLDDPSGSRAPRRWATAVFTSRHRRLLLIASAVLAAASPLRGALSGPLPGSGPTVDAISSALLLTCVAVGATLTPAALLARSTWSSLPRRLRPWAGGWMAAPVLLTACLLGEGFGAGLALALRGMLGGPSAGSTGLRLPAVYDGVTLLWGTVTVLLVLCGAALLVGLAVRWLRSDGSVSQMVALLHAGRQQDQRRAARAWEWARLRRDHTHHAFLLVAGILAVGALLAVVLRVLGTPDWDWAGWLVALGVGSLATLAVSSLRMVHLAVRRPEAARQVGLLCDLALFWPREAHPVVPPCYAVKVIPELVERAAEHLADPDTRVVLVGHSQGSLLAAVATARLLDELPDEATRERVGLVTAGSSLQWGYARAFPAVVGHHTQRGLAGSLGGRWRSLCRGTDPLGGGVATWNRQVFDGTLIGVGFRPDGGQGPLPAATRGPTGALVLGGDHWLPDPQRGPFPYRRWVPGVLTHADYSGDPEWDRAVSVAAGLETPVRGANLPLQAGGPATTTPPAATPAATPTVTSGGAVVSREPAVIGDQLANGDTAPEADTPAARDSESERDDGDDPDVPEQAGGAPQPPVADPPEIVEPRGSLPPWQRAPALREVSR